MYENILIFFLIFNLIILMFFNKITNIFNIYDQQDGIRKFQKKAISLIGGTIIYVNLIYFFILDFIFPLNLFDNSFLFYTREYFILIFGISFCYLLGLYDDKYQFSANQKLIYNIILISILLLIDDSLIITELKFSFLSELIELRSFSFVFTLLCFLLFINALNMFDGINLQVITYSCVIFSIFIFKNVFLSISCIIIMSLIFVGIYNFRNKAYLGDSGTQLLSFIISYIFIKSYNLDYTFLSDEIFIIMMLPGLDMFRLFLYRIYNGKHPFKADLNHFHHILKKKFSPFLTFLIPQLIIILFILLYYLIENKIHVLVTCISFYILVLVLLKKVEKN